MRRVTSHYPKTVSRASLCLEASAVAAVITFIVKVLLGA